MKLSADFLQKSLLVIFFGSLILSTSCDMVSDESLDTSVYDLESIQPACPINADDLAKILDRDLTSQINCLEDNLLKFTSFVKLSNKEEIKKSELETFVNKFLSSKPEEVRSYLNILFQINSIALKDADNIMKVTTIPLFVDLVRHINRHGRVVKKLLSEINADNYIGKRSDLITSLRSLSQSLLSTIRKKESNDYQIDIIDFALEIKKAANINDEDLNIQKVEELLFLKRLILGGDYKTLTSKNFEELIARSSLLVTIYFDLVEAKKRDFEKESSFYKFLLSAIIELNNLVMKNKDSEVYFFDTDLINTLNHFVDGTNWKKIGVSLQVFKADVVGGDANYYDKKDIRKLFEYAKETFESLFFFGFTYEQLEDELVKNEVIVDLSFPDSPEYAVISEDRLVPLWHDFLDVARSYRTFPEENNLTLFSYKYNRTRWGFLLQAALRYAGQKLFEVYHTGLDKRGELSVDKDQIRNIVLDYQDALKEFGLWPSNLERLVNELLMGSDLFQFASNGDQLLQRIELAQYLPTVIGANIIGKEVHNHLEIYCIPNEDLSYDIPCYRDNFFQSLFFDMDKIKNFPNFFGYYSTTPWLGTQQYLKDVEKMARIDPDPAVPMTKVDISRLVTSMSNTESLFLKYDKNQNGELDRSELDKIYEVLRLTLAEEANLKPSSKLLKSVYLYIVKKQKEPTTAALLWFHAFGKKKNIVANRSTIAGVLKMFGYKKKP
ncbi:MAG: hypothetical protein CME70_03895 [Halobacteriovorax sp.]|nr:hypothetical protein [Halobacteriovorax sp.]